MDKKYTIAVAGTGYVSVKSRYVHKYKYKDTFKGLVREGPGE